MRFRLDTLADIPQIVCRHGLKLHEFNIFQCKIKIDSFLHISHLLYNSVHQIIITFKSQLLLLCKATFFF